MRLPRSALTRRGDAAGGPRRRSDRLVARRVAAAGQQAHHRERRDRLAAAGLADEAQRLAALDLERHVAHRVQRAARRGDVDAEALDLEQRPATSGSGLRSCPPLRREQVAQAVADEVDREAPGAPARCREWRSARTRRTCTTWPRRSSAPTTAAAAARRGRGRTAPPRAGSRWPPRRVATTIRCGSTLGSTSPSSTRAVEAPAASRGGDVVERAHLLRGAAHDDGEAVPLQQAEHQDHDQQRAADQRHDGERDQDHRHRQPRGDHEADQRGRCGRRSSRRRCPAWCRSARR